MPPRKKSAPGCSRPGFPFAQADPRQRRVREQAGGDEPAARRAVAAGEIRADVSPEDLLRALVGMCYMHDQPGWQSTVLRLLDVFVDGLRARGVRKATARSRTTATKKSAARTKKR